MNGEYEFVYLTEEYFPVLSIKIKFTISQDGEIIYNNPILE